MNDMIPSDQIVRDIRPAFATSYGRGPLWTFGLIAALSAGLLFYALEARRTGPQTMISLSPVAPAGNLIASPPDPQIPSGNDPLQDQAWASPLPTGEATSDRGSRSPLARNRADTATVRPPPSLYVPPMPREPLPQASPEGADASVVFAAPSGRPSANVTEQTASKQVDRANATTFKNPSMTIPFGTVIQAVLETALDSNRAGFARAIVSNDIYGFDGTRVLVPKGSRLIGEYKADLTAGQNRALIQWQRLMRPDGVIIDINSPAADPLGRAGIRGKVNGHFLERFSGAILQSILDIGVQLATQRVARDTVVVALPGTAATAAAPLIATEKVQRTLTVKQGSSVSVFVSRDLDFSSVAS